MVSHLEDRIDGYRFCILVCGAAVIPIFFFPLTPDDPFLVPKEVLFSGISSLLALLLFLPPVYGTREPAAGVAALLFLFSMAVSIPGSLNYHWGIEELRRWTGMLVLFLSAQKIVWTPRRLGTLMTAVVVTGAVVSLFVLLEYREVLLIPGLNYTEGRIQVFFGHQNILGQHLAVAVLWGIGCSVAARTRRRRAFFISLAVLSALALLVTFCRAALLAALTASVIFIYLRKVRLRSIAGMQGTSGRSNLLLMTVAALTTLVIVLFIWYDGKTSRLVSSAFARSDSYRLVIWCDTIRMFAAHPLRGIGLGNFPMVYPVFQSRDFPWLTLYAYNDMLHLLAETGIIGIAGLGVFLYYAAGRIRGQWQVRRHEVEVDLRRGILCGCFCTMLQGMVSYDLHSPASAYLFFSGLGMLCSGVPVAATPGGPSPSAARRFLLPVLAAAIAFMGLFTSYDRIMGHYFYNRSLLSLEARNNGEAVSYSLRALVHRPFDAGYHHLAARAYLAYGDEGKTWEHLHQAALLSPYLYKDPEATLPRGPLIRH